VTTTVKIRRVGNSNVVSLPRGLEAHGFGEGAAVSLIPLKTGQLLLVSGDQIEAYIDSFAQQVIDENGEALEKLAAYDRSEEKIAVR